MSVRVRFAPSPTGYLHIGGARTALFNWLYARHTGGVFVLRIEDTDANRNSQEAVEVILEGLRWLGLDWDEGPTSGDAKGPSKGDCGPYFQSQRRELYKNRVQELIAKGAAYESEGAVKFKMHRNPTIIPDLVVGDVKRVLTDREEIDPDFVLVRSDGQPVFHLVNVIDDIEMRITHVVRGEDHLANTAKHLALFHAFGVEPPKYAHIPLILNPNGSKMSKRDVGASLSSYWEQGFVPEAVVNYLYLLGWSPKGNREMVPLDEVVQMFDLPQILRHNARFDLAKLQWLNWEHIKQMPQERFNRYAGEFLKKAGFPVDHYPAEYINAAFTTCKEKVKQFTDAPLFSDFYFVDEVAFDDAARKQITPENQKLVAHLMEAIRREATFTSDSIGALIKKCAGELGVKAGALVHPTRAACTGKEIGPSLYHLMEVLGREKVLRRLDRFIASPADVNPA